MTTVLGLAVMILYLADILIHVAIYKRLKRVDILLTSNIECLFAFLKKDLNRRLMVRYGIIFLKVLLVLTSLVYFAYCLNNAVFATVLGMTQMMSMWNEFQSVKKLRADKRNLANNIKMMQVKKGN